MKGLAEDVSLHHHADVSDLVRVCGENQSWSHPNIKRHVYASTCMNGKVGTTMRFECIGLNVDC